MKKAIILIICIAILCLVFSACELSLNKDGGDAIAQLTQLPEPNLIEIVDNYVYWEEVPNASSYVVKINNYQENAGNQLKYSIPSIMDGRLDYNVPTELHIYVKAKGNQILYADSEWSKELTYTYTKSGNANTDDGTKTKLSIPSNIQMNGNVLSWNEVLNASGYQIRIEGYQSIISTAMAYYDFVSVFGESTSFNAQIRSVASKDSIYADSDWTVMTSLYYRKDEERVQIGFSDTYKSNGLGRTIDLINSTSYKPKNGTGYIFNEQELFSRTLIEENIRDQKATYEYGTSFDSFYSKWQFNVGLKVANNHLGINGMNFLPGTADFNVDVKGGYEQVRQEDTKELYIKMHHNIVGKSVEILGHAFPALPFHRGFGIGVCLSSEEREQGPRQHR